MQVRRALPFVLLGGLAACGDGAQSSSSGGATPSPTAAAPITLASCGIGTRIASDATSCVPVGPTEVPEGFERADDWGMKPINAFGKCPERFFSKLGRRDCEAIDRACPTPFAPPGATVVHDQAELEAAIAAARQGATIALDEGTYGPIVVDKDLSLVGRCPEKTFVRAAGVDGHGIEVRGARTLSIRSLAIIESEYGLWATDKAKISVTQTLFSGNGAAAWIQAGAELTLTHGLVRGAKQKMADGVLVARGGHATLTDMQLEDMHVALQAFGVGSTAKATGIVVNDRSPEPLAALVIASHGGDVLVDRSLFFAESTFIGGASATDPREKGAVPAKLRITSSNLMRTLPTDSGGFDVSGGSTLELVNDTLESRARVAISATEGAKVSLERTVVRPVLPTDVEARAIGAGLVVDDGVQVSLDRSAIVGVMQAGVMASRECHIRMVGSLVANVWEASRDDFGKRFASGQAISLSGNATLDLEDSTLADNAGAAIWSDRGGETSVRVARSAIVVTREPERSTSVAGIMAWGGTIDVDGSLFHGIPGASLALGEVTGAVRRSTLSRAEVAFRLLGLSHTVSSSTPDRRPEPGEIVTHENVVIETPSLEAKGDLPLGDCRCKE
ncbi:MAG: hypothetical protein JST00_01740 [Deltaproteobacteria bacterium]|nr:hypothetical protein [Deltaproteobacteria bacterium]